MGNQRPDHAPGIPDVGAYWIHNLLQENAVRFITPHKKKIFAMKIRIKRLDRTLPLPQYKTKSAAGFDVYARTTTVIKPKEISYIPLNVVLEIPSRNLGDAGAKKFHP